MRNAARFLTSVISIFLLLSQAQGGTVSGVIQNSQAGPLANGTLTFTLSQGATLAGTANVVATTVSCYTDAGGNVVGEPNGATPTLTSNPISGTLQAGTYFVRVTFSDATGQSFPGTEASLQLIGNGTLIVSIPLQSQSPNATSYSVYISTTSGAETLQGTVTVSAGSWPSYSQSAPLSAGSAMPASNTTACKLRFNDELNPSFTCYTVGLVGSTGISVPGYPQTWNLAGGATGTVNVSLGTPQGNVCQQQGWFFPQPVLQTPQFGAGQSVGGPITLPSVNKVLWIDGAIIPNISACLAQLPAAVYGSCDNGQQCYVSGGGECHAPSGYTEILTANIVMQNAKHLVLHAPAFIHQGSFQVTAVGGSPGAHGWSVMCAPGEDHSLEASGCTWDYTGSTDQWAIGTSAGSVNDFTIQGQQIHCFNGGTGCNPLHVQNAKDAKLIDVDVVCNGTSGNTGNGLIFEGTGGTLNGANVEVRGLTQNQCNTPFVIQGATSHAKFSLGSGGGAAGTPGALFTVQGSTSSVDLDIPSMACCSGTTAWTSQINFAGSATGNTFKVVHNSHTTQDITFGASASKNVGDCMGGGCTVTDNNVSGNNTFRDPNNYRQDQAGNLTIAGTLKAGTVTLINLQGTTGTLTGNSSDQTVYTYTLPANTLPAGKCLRLTTFFNHPSGVASVTYHVFFGGTSVTSNSATIAGTFYYIDYICNNSGVTNAQTSSTINNVNSTGVLGGGAGTTADFSPLNPGTIDTTQNQILKLTFNVANTDTVTGGQWFVELLQ